MGVGVAVRVGVTVGRPGVGVEIEITGGTGVWAAQVGPNKGVGIIEGVERSSVFWDNDVAAGTEVAAVIRVSAFSRTISEIRLFTTIRATVQRTNKMNKRIKSIIDSGFNNGEKSGDFVGELFISFIFVAVKRKGCLQ
jgi:hypothetical protein